MEFVDNSIGKFGDVGRAGMRNARVYWLKMSVKIRFGEGTGIDGG